MFKAWFLQPQVSRKELTDKNLDLIEAKFQPLGSELLKPEIEEAIRQNC
jgi:hypothetical protein